MKALLQQILDSGAKADHALDMNQWINGCGTAACLCGDVALAALGKDQHESELLFFARNFSDQLDCASEDVFWTDQVANAIYQASAYERFAAACESDQFTDEELNHPHLNEDHNSREIAHNFVRLVMCKIEEQES